MVKTTLTRSIRMVIVLLVLLSSLSLPVFADEDKLIDLGDGNTITLTHVTSESRDETGPVYTTTTEATVTFTGQFNFTDDSKAKTTILTTLTPGGSDIVEVPVQDGMAVLSNPGEYVIVPLLEDKVIPLENALIMVRVATP